MTEDGRHGEEVAQKPRHRDKGWLKENYTETDKTLKEVAEDCDVGEAALSTWVRKFGLGENQRKVDLSDVDIPDQAPWKDADLMESLYIDKRLSPNDISGIFDCAPNTVRKWLDSHGIEKRSRTQAAANAHGTLNYASFRTKKTGREVWKSREHTVLVYRLLAVAEWGFDEVVDYDIHHENGIPWDNRPGNLELVTNEEHQKKHRRITGVDRLRVAEMYEHGDCSSYELADALDMEISPGTVIKIHKEHYGGSVA